MREWLVNHDFEKESGSVPNPQNYTGRVFRYVNDIVTVDVLAGAVRDGDAQVDIPAHWILKNKNNKRLVLLSGRTTNNIPVVRLDALWALRLQAGRDRDLSDLFSMFALPINEKEIKQMFNDLWCEKLEEKLLKVSTKDHDLNIY